MLYRPVWVFCILIYRIFYKHFFLKNNKIDLSKPTIIVSNHNNAFLDPIIYAALIMQRLYFIVRGDIFNTPLKRWVLWNLGQIPMFRIRDGVDNVKRNESSFEQCYDLLARKKNILIFPEADCVQKKRLRGLKKGTARMAFGAVEKHGWDIDLQLLPVMNSYTYPKEFRTVVMTNIGQPIKLNDYRKLYEEDENKALTKLTEDVRGEMIKEFVHIEDAKNDDLFERLVVLKRTDAPSSTIPWLQRSSKRFDMEKGLADILNNMSLEGEKRNGLEEKSRNYFRSLIRNRVSDKALMGKTPNSVLGFLIALIGFPIYVLGILLNIFQYTFADNIAKKKIKDIIFKNSIRYGMLLATNVIMGVVLMVVAGMYFGWKGVLLAPVFQFLVTYIAIIYHEFVQEWLQTLSASKINLKEKEELIATRQQILDLL